LSAQSGGNEIAENRHKVWQPLSGQLIKGSARAEQEKNGIQFPFMCISKSDRTPSVFIINSGNNFSPLCRSDTHKENINKLFN
jgi:hypothetical protein